MLQVGDGTKQAQRGARSVAAPTDPSESSKAGSAYLPATLPAPGLAQPGATRRKPDHPRSAATSYNSVPFTNRRKKFAFTSQMRYLEVSRVTFHEAPRLTTYGLVTVQEAARRCSTKQK